MGTIAENVKRLREDLRMTQPELAKKAGVSQQLISQIEKGENDTTKKLPALARALGVSVTDIDGRYEVGDREATEVAMATDGAEEIRVLFRFVGGEPSPADEELFRLLAEAPPEERQGFLQLLRARKR